MKKGEKGPLLKSVGIGGVALFVVIVAPLSVTVKLTLRPDVDDVIAIGDDGSKVPTRRVTPVQLLALLREPSASIALRFPPVTEALAVGSQVPPPSKFTSVSVKSVGVPPDTACPEEFDA